MRKITKTYLPIYAYNDFENIHRCRPMYKYEYFEMNNM